MENIIAFVYAVSLRCWQGHLPLSSSLLCCRLYTQRTGCRQSILEKSFTVFLDTLSNNCSLGLGTGVYFGRPKKSPHLSARNHEALSCNNSEKDVARWELVVVELMWWLPKTWTRICRVYTIGRHMRGKRPRNATYWPSSSFNIAHSVVLTVPRKFQAAE